MFQRGPGSLAMVLEDQNVFEPPILLQIENAIPEGPQHVFDSLWRQCRQARSVVRSLDDYFMRPDPVHSVEHPLSLTVQIALDAESRKLVRYNSNRPSRRVPLRRRPSIRIRPVRLNLRWSLPLIAVAKRAESPLNLHVLAYEIGRALGPVRRDDYPTANNGIFSKLRHFTESFPYAYAKSIF